MRTPPALLAAALLGACAHHSVPPDAQIVRNVGFEGNGRALAAAREGTSDYNLRTAMEQGTSPTLFGRRVLPRGEVALSEHTLTQDAWRIETWYAHQGYFDAEMRGWQVLVVDEHRPDRRAWLGWWRRRAGVIRRAGRAEVVDVIGYVEPGEPSLVGSVTWEGLEAIGAPLLRQIRRDQALREGSRFELQDHLDTVARTEELLRNSSFAHVHIDSRVEVYPDEHRVDVTYTGHLGPSCVFGDVDLVGDFELPSDLVRDEILISPGRKYSASQLVRTQTRLFGLGVFSVVNVRPELGEGDSSVIPVEIELAEGTAQQLRLGGGLAFESGRQDVHLSGDYNHNNARNRLWQVSVEGSGGYATVASAGDLVEGVGEAVRSGGPTADLTLTLGIPRFPQRGWLLSTDLDFELGIEEGYRFASPELVPSLTRKLSEQLWLTTAYHLRYFDFLDVDVDLSAIDPELGLSIADPYLLSYVAERVEFDGRDDPLYPRRGRYGQAEVSLAGLGGNYRFVRGVAEGRVYLPLAELLERSGGTVAARLAGGAIRPWGADPTRSGVPIPERLYLGGSDTVRGWTLDHLGPYYYDACNTQREDIPVPDGQGPVALVDDETSCTSSWELASRDMVAPDADTLPVGGLFSLLGSAEVRYYWPSDLGAVVFVDVGMAWNDWEEVDLSLLQPSVGVGGRYKSAVGPVRLDVARRLRQDDYFFYEPRWSAHLSITEAF